MTVGENIKKARKKRKLTQKKLGELSGINEVTIRKYESGRVVPKLENLSKISFALDVPIDFLEERYYERYATEVLPHEDIDRIKDNIKSDYYGYTTKEKKAILEEIENEETFNGDLESLKHIPIKYEMRILNDIILRFDESELYSFLELVSSYESLEDGARHKIVDYALDLCEIPIYKKSIKD